MNKGLQWKLLVIILIFLFSLLQIFPLPKFNEWNDSEKWSEFFSSLNIIKNFPKSINLGLDLQGGMYLVIQVDTQKIREQAKKDNVTDVEKKVQDAVDKAYIVLQKRVDEFGVAEPSIVKSGEKIIIQLPGMKDRNRAKSLVGSTASLEFKMVHLDNDKLLKYLVDDQGNLLPGKEIPAGYEILYENPRNRDGSYKLDENGNKIKKPYLISQKVELSGGDLKDAFVEFNQQTNQPYIQLIMNHEATKRFAELTNKYKPVSEVYRYLAIVLDNKVIMAPRIMSKIDNGRPIIEGGFSLEEAKDVAITLRAGALPAPIQIVQESMVGPSLGKDSIKNGLKAAVVGIMLVVLFMLWRYSMAGFLAILAVIFNSLILLAAMAILGATLSLPGIAGIILTIGMAVDANIIVYERIKEELRAGKTVKNAIEQGYDRAFVAIFDSNLTTLITAIVLYQFGIGPIKGFAVTLSIGLIANMFTALFCTKVYYSLIIGNKQVKTLSIFPLFTNYKTQIEKKLGKTIKFTSLIYVCLTFSFVMIMIGLVSLGIKGLKYGIDFTGGASIIIKFDHPITVKDIEELREEFSKNGLVGNLQDFKSADETVTSRIKFVTTSKEKKSSNIKIQDISSKIHSILEKKYVDTSDTMLQNKINLNSELDDKMILDVIYDIVSNVVMEEIQKLKPITNMDSLMPIFNKYKINLDTFKENYTTAPKTLMDSKKNINDLSDKDLKQYIIQNLSSNEHDYKIIIDKINEIKRNGLLKSIDSLKQAGLNDKMIEKFKEKFYLARYVIENIQEIGPSISADYSRRTIYSIIWALILMLIYIGWRFEFKFGVGAIFSLVHDVLFTLGLFSIFNLEFDTQVVAALLTLVGYSVNDTIIIDDRIRENMRTMKNKTMTEIIDFSITQTLNRTISTSVTVFLTVLSLYIFGGETLRGFSFAMLAGVIFGTYSSIYISAPVLIFWKTKKGGK